MFPKLSVFYRRQLATQLCQPPLPTKPIVTIINAYSRIGQSVALLLKQSPYINELRLYDSNKEVCNVAEDLSHIDTKAKVRSFRGLHVIRQAIEGADVLVHLGGCQTKSGETTKQLFERNVDNVRMTALYAAEFNPKGIFCIQSPPVECLVPMVVEEYKKAGVFDERKIIGITSVPTMMANYYIGTNTGCDPSEVLTPIVGGSTPYTIVPIFSQVRPQHRLDTAALLNLHRSITEGEDNVLKKSHCADGLCLTTAVGVSRFINNVVKAVLGENNCVDCAFVKQVGHIEKFLPYMTSIVRFGRQGVVSTHMPKINDMEAYRLKKAAMFIKTNIKMGESFVAGEKFLEFKEKPLDKVPKDECKKEQEPNKCA